MCTNMCSFNFPSYSSAALRSAIRQHHLPGSLEPRTSASKFALVNTASMLFSPSILLHSIFHRFTAPAALAALIFLSADNIICLVKTFPDRIIFRFSSILSHESHRFTHAHILIRHTAFPLFHVYYMQIFMTYHGGRSAYRSACLPRRTLSHTLS